MQSQRDQLLAPLKRYFGFGSFRPLQEEIMRDALAGRDVFAVLPTGGGKSLCFQLPALVRPGLTVVVSPLIALMKDQVDAMQAAGVAATFLNSSLAAGESRPRMRGLHQGEFRLLYVSPERLMLSGFLEDLKLSGTSTSSRWMKPIASANGGTISGPEYRQISNLRQFFPGVPVMALTATATERVRGDIVTQLHLQNPACYVASFNRPNLTYRVAAKAGSYEQILSYIRSRRSKAASSMSRPAKPPTAWPTNSRPMASGRCPITRAWMPARAGKTRRRFCAMKRGSSAPPSPLAWASTSPTSAS